MSETINKTTEAARLEASLLPPVEVIEDTSGITLCADLPGVPEGRLHLHVEADTLSIEGEVPLKMRAGMESSHADVCLPRYRSVFSLSKGLDTEQVAVEFGNGVLRLRIPKAAHAQPRKIEICVE